MITMDDLVYTINEMHDEISFSYKGNHYFVSACNAPEGKILVCAPGIREYVDNIDQVLDIIVDGKPLRNVIL